MSKAGDIAVKLERNCVESLPKGELQRKLELAEKENRPLRVKLGIDPTAPDIHLGHTVVLQKLKEFQELGHTVFLIIGDFTARVGDPSGQSKTRPELSLEEIDDNAATFQEQAFKVLNKKRTEVRRNSEWFDKMFAQNIGFFHLMRQATVAQILERDDFEKRYKSGQPISLLELLYPLLQGHDSVVIKADIEIGGTDQKFNLLMGRHLLELGAEKPQAILTMPILPGTDGKLRMSKSTGNYIGITEPPEEIFGKVMSIPDEVMALYYDLLLGEELNSDDPNKAKRALASKLVDRFHGEGAGAAAEEHFNLVHKQRSIPEEIEEVELSDFVEDGGTVHLPALIAAGFGVSRSEARRSIEQAGVKLDGETLGGDKLDLAQAELTGKVLQLGKRRFMRLIPPKN